MAFANVEEGKEYYKSWREKNKAYMKKYAREYRKKNKDRIRKLCKDWEDRNRDKVRLRKRRFELVCEYCNKKYRGFLENQRFCCHKCAGASFKCPYNKRFTTPDGRDILLHRYVMECHLGRKLEPKEVVHHINLDRTDNRIENLMLFPTNSEHIAYHRKHFPENYARGKK